MAIEEEVLAAAYRSALARVDATDEALRILSAFQPGVEVIDRAVAPNEALGLSRLEVTFLGAAAGVLVGLILLVRRSASRVEGA